MDITTKRATDTTVITILDPQTGEPMVDTETNQPLTVTVYGPGSKQFAAAKAASSTKAMQRLKQRGNVKITAEEETANTAAFLTACTAAFGNISYGDLEGPDLYRAVYSDTGLGWLTEQVNREMGDWANFTKAA